MVILLKRLRLHRKLSRFLAAQHSPENIENAEVEKVWQTLLRSHGIPVTKIPLLPTGSLGPALVRQGWNFRLLIPQTVCEELPGEVLPGILRHELAHYRNRDSFWTPFFRSLAAVLWFHPLAWKALRNYEAAVEWCCDEFAYLKPQSDTSGSELLAKTFLVIHQSTESLALNLSTFACFNTVERVARLARSETLGKEHVMKKTLFFVLLGTLFLGGTLHIRLVAQNEPPKFPLTFQSEEELAAFFETYTPPPPSPETPKGKKAIDQNNLRMLGLAFHNYSDAWQVLPSSSTSEDGTGKPMHSWRVALLPYMEQTELYEKIRLDEPWDSEYNKQFHTQMPDSFRNPYLTDEQSRKGLTNYVVIVGTLPGVRPRSYNPNYPNVEAIFRGPNSWDTYGRISDGLPNTILFAQRREPVCWMDPTGDVPIKLAVQGIGTVKNGLGGVEGSEGINIAFADGSVHFAPNMGPNPMLEAALTCNGGESLAWEPEKMEEISSTVSIEGVITLDGIALPDIQIGFIPNDRYQKGVAISSDSNGRFHVPMGAIKTLQPGEYRVAVRVGLANDPRRDTFPKKYDNPNTTPLLVQLNEGKNVIDFALTSQ